MKIIDLKKMYLTTCIYISRFVKSIRDDIKPIRDDIFIVVGIFVIVAVLFYGAVYHDETIRREEQRLMSCGYEKLKTFRDDYNSAELLARKRCDDKFGIGNYTFTSTNFNCYVYFLAQPK